MAHRTAQSSQHSPQESGRSRGAGETAARNRRTYSALLSSPDTRRRDGLAGLNTARRWSGLAVRPCRRAAARSLEHRSGRRRAHERLITAAREAPARRWRPPSPRISPSSGAVPSPSSRPRLASRLGGSGAAVAPRVVTFRDRAGRLRAVPHDRQRADSNDRQQSGNRLPRFRDLGRCGQAVSQPLGAIPQDARSHAAAKINPWPVSHVSRSYSYRGSLAETRSQIAAPPPGPGSVLGQPRRQVAKGTEPPTLRSVVAPGSADSHRPSGFGHSEQESAEDG